MSSPHVAKPFASEIALANSGYASFADGELRLCASAEPASALAGRIHAALRALVLDPEFPCVGARSALNQSAYRFALYPEMNAEGSTAGLAHDLHEFVAEQDGIEGEFSTFIACFDAPKFRDLVEFEDALWRQLKALHATDREHHSWDPAVSRDPADPRFSFSFGGRAFFVVGLSPASERWARQFPWPTLAFNAHFQFEQLRASGGFSRMQNVIRERDKEIEGDINPNLADFGDHTEARQYSGRAVGDEWRCPVRFE
jgi:FPC/CPF motif-containing protein YcgG